MPERGNPRGSDCTESFSGDLRDEPLDRTRFHALDPSDSRVQFLVGWVGVDRCRERARVPGEALGPSVSSEKRRAGRWASRVAPACLCWPKRPAAKGSGRHFSIGPTEGDRLHVQEGGDTFGKFESWPCEIHVNGAKATIVTSQIGNNYTRFTARRSLLWRCASRTTS
jgi:hypothetical protein